MQQKSYIKLSTLLALAAPLTMSTALTGCSKSNTAASAPAVSLSGSLTASGTNARIARKSSDPLARQIKNVVGGGPSSLLVDFTTKHIHCVTADAPPVEADGTIATDGTFNVNITGAKGKPLTCTVMDASNSVIATFVVSDSSKKDMNGNSAVNDSPAYPSSSNKLGTLDMNLDTGNIDVPASQIKDDSGATVALADAAATLTNPFDPTGVWTIADVDFTLPKGVLGTCSANQHDDTCNGPPLGMKLFLNRLSGTNNADNSAVYGMQVWQDENGDPQSKYTQCGSMTGLSTAEAATAGVTVTGGGTPGSFSFATTVTDTHTSSSATITDGYKLSTATAMYSQMPCSPKSISAGGKTYNVYSCGPDASGNGSPGGRYQANLGGGCVDAAGTAVNNIDWSKVTFGTCTPATSAITGFYKNSCTSTYNGATITCTNEWGIFDDANLSTASTKSGDFPAFNFSSLTPTISQNANCSTATTALAKVNCYAQYYDQYARNLNACLPKVNMDWSTTDPATFAKTDMRPQSLVFMEKLSYADANSASMLTQQNENRGVRTLDSSGHEQWISCGAIERGGLAWKRISDTKLLAKYVSATSTTSVDKAACVGASWNGTKQTFLFYLNKN